MIQDVKDLGAELKLEPFRDTEIFQQSRIQVPEVRALYKIPYASVLSWQGNAEERLGTCNVAAIVVRIRRISN